MTALSDEELTHARDLAGATYLSAYLHLMMRQLGVDDSDHESINAMAVQMIESMNLATEAAFRGLMNDHTGVDDTLYRFSKAVKALPD